MFELLIAAVIVVALLMGGSYLPFFWASRPRRQAFDSITKAFGGYVTRGIGWPRSWIVVFRYRDASAKIEIFLKSRRSRLKIQIGLGTPSVLISKLNEKEVTSIVEKEIGGRFMLTDTFHGLKVWQRHAPQSGGLRTQLEAIRAPLQAIAETPQAAAWILAHGTSVVSLSSKWSIPIEQSEPLIAFIRNVLRVYDLWNLEATGEIEFNGQRQVEVLDSVVCKVCGEPITEDLALCKRCKSAHHQECWAYNGVCGAYGCRGLEWETPPIVFPALRRDATTLTAAASDLKEGQTQAPGPLSSGEDVSSTP